MYIIWISFSFLEIVVDYYLGHTLELYHFAEEAEKLSLEAFTTKLFMSPLFAIPFLNFMPNKFSPFIPYWLLWAAFATFFEWTTVHTGYLTYTGWKLWYSAIFYTFIFPIVRWHYYYIKH
ncbi:CBO0543 family protein [Bacillus alkalicellulosilyticus]|uniref:CBO0543 family protein n=1 Tax=Alkalihalobacterium alkalicellulosilyticum TaxID=1912214 RepID=UPI00148288FA|nr:CBO0543 family protein [Bacillus alkalicellulosilyticus]